MKIKTKLIRIFLSCLFLWMAGSPILAQDKIEDLKDDIYIMETILDKLLQASRNYLFNGKNIKGFYFDDYGLLFTVNLENQIGIWGVSAGNGPFAIVDGKLSEIKNKSEESKDAGSKNNTVIVAPKLLYQSFSSTFGGRIDEEDFDLWVKKLDKKIQTFMSSYVDVNDYLPIKDKVSVVVFFGKSNQSTPKARIYQAEKKAITDVRRNAVSAKAFGDKITKEFAAGEDHMEDIDMMSTILKTALEDKKESRYRRFRGSIHGVFLKDLGVMFSFGDHFRSSSANFRLFTVPESESVGYLQADAFIRRQQKEASEQKKQFREKLSQFEENIIKVVGQYGSLSLQFGTERSSGGDVSNVIIRMKKSDLVDFSTKKLSLANLKKRAQIVEY